VWLGALGAFCPDLAHAQVSGTWTGPGGEWTTGGNWTSTPTANTVPDDIATFTNNGAPTSVTISNSTSINTIEFDVAAPAYSFTVQDGATFTITNQISPGSSLLPAFTVNTGATMALGDGAFAEIASLAGGGNVVVGPSDPSTTLIISGSNSTTFSGRLSGAGTLEIDGGAVLTLTGQGSTIGGVDLCNCDANGGLTINGGSLNVTDPGLGTVVEGGTLSVINGGTLQTPSLAVVFSSAMVIDGAGSTVTVSPSGLTEFASIGGPVSVTISNGGVLNTPGLVAIDAGDPVFTPTVTVTGSGSTWNVGSLAVGGSGTFEGPGILTISNGGVVNATGPLGVGDPTGTSMLTVTGAGSVLNALTSLVVGDTSCGCGLIGTLTVADGGVVNSPGFTGIAQGSTLNLGTGGLAGGINTPAIDNEGQIVANFTDTLTLAADISGAGTLGKAGVGTLILTGNNSYAGGTTITGGFINFNSANSFGSGLITINGGGLQWATGNSADISAQLAAFGAGGATFDTNGNNVTLAASLSGPGGLIKTGAGTMTLSGVNSYQGGTAINGGTVAVTADANLGAAAGGLAFGGGTLQFLSGFTTNRTVTLSAGGGTLDTNGNNATLAGAIGGAGGLTKVGAGTMTLSGASTYLGGTTVNAGTLQAGAANVFAPASAYTIANGATLNLAGFNQSIGSLAGAGAVTLGAATLTTGNDNTSTTFSGAISGTGGLTKIGTGTLLLTGTSNYTGATTVNAGTLSVNGSIASSALTVNAGGTIGGNGTIGNTTINGGTLSPGNSIGTLTVQGNLVLTSASAYLVEVSPTAADRTNVTGTASLAGTVQAVFGPGNSFARTYTILSAAGGSTGTFGSLTTTGLPAGFTASLSYTATDAILNLTAILGGPSALGTGGLSTNQRNVTGSLNTFFNNGGTLPPGFLPIFGLTGGNLGNALSQLSGEAATGGQQVAFQMTNQFLGLMLDPFVDGRSGTTGAAGPALAFAPEREDLPDDIALAYSSVLKAPPKTLSFEQRWSVWGGAYGGANRTSGDPAGLGSHNLSANAAGFAAGFDYHLTPSTVVGLALAGGGTSWSLENGLGGGKSDAFQAGVYGATRWGAAYVAAALSFTNHWMSTDRFAFAGDHLTASFNAQSFGARVESGYRFATIFGGLTPYAAIQAQNFRTPGYSETDVNGGGFGLAYAGRTGTDTRSELGARFDRLLALNPNAVLTLRARLAWAHDWVSDPVLAAAFQALPGASFIVNGATPAKNSALASAGTELRLANGVTLLGKFDGEFASRSTTYAGTGTIRYSW
jgi:autotransporter-associated beta strand protein/T5SS/PEP-CTERM-associated repeat protein